VYLVGQPRRWQEHPGALGQDPDFTEILSRMGKIQNAHRIGPMPLDKSLNPFCTIMEGSHLSCLIDSWATHLTGGQVRKGVRVR
jgi:hypothetical protein